MTKDKPIRLKLFAPISGSDARKHRRSAQHTVGEADIIVPRLLFGSKSKRAHFLVKLAEGTKYQLDVSPSEISSNHVSPGGAKKTIQFQLVISSSGTPPTMVDVTIDSLKDTDDPDAEFDRGLQAIVRTFADDNDSPESDCVAHFLQNKGVWLRHIETELLAQYGLQCDVSIHGDQYRDQRLAELHNETLDQEVEIRNQGTPIANYQLTYVISGYDPDNLDKYDNLLHLNSNEQIFEKVRFYVDRHVSEIMNEAPEAVQSFQGHQQAEFIKRKVLPPNLLSLRFGIFIDYAKLNKTPTNPMAQPERSASHSLRQLEVELLEQHGQMVRGARMDKAEEVWARIEEIRRKRLQLEEDILTPPPEPSSIAPIVPHLPASEEPPLLGGNSGNDSSHQEPDPAEEDPDLDEDNSQPV